MRTLRKQMEADMALRGLAYRTRQAYIESVAKLAKFYGKSPDQITEPECQQLPATPAHRAHANRGFVRAFSVPWPDNGLIYHA